MSVATDRSVSSLPANAYSVDETETGYYAHVYIRTGLPGSAYGDKYGYYYHWIILLL